MSAPLPRVFEDVGGKVQPVSSGPGSSNAVIGGEFKADDLTRTTKEVVSSSGYKGVQLATLEVVQRHGILCIAESISEKEDVVNESHFVPCRPRN